MSEPAASTNASPVKDENQNKETPVSIRSVKIDFQIERRYREKKTFYRRSQRSFVVDNLRVIEKRIET